jgi:hypothetical protein
MHPYEIFGGYWKITLPTGRDGKAEEVLLPALETYTGPHFYVNATGDGAVFMSPTRGPTTSSRTKYARSEVREMTADNKLAAWSTASGVHSMDVELSVDTVPQGEKPHVVVAQIHGGKDDVCVIRFEGSTTDRTIGKLWITDGDNTRGHFVANVRLGERIRVGFHAQNGIIRFAFNGAPVAYEQRKNEKKCYFKAGCYIQTDEVLPAGADFAQVTIYQLAVAHSDVVKPVDPPADDFAKRLASLEATFYAYKALVDGRFDAIKKAVTQ